MGGKAEDDDYKCPPIRTGWLNDCHRQLLEANLLVLTVLAEREGGVRRHTRGVAEAECQVVSQPFKKKIIRPTFSTVVI